MRSMTLLGSDRTQGERRMIVSYITTGAFGAVVALLVVLRLGEEESFHRALSLYEIWILSSGALGAMLALRMTRDRLGRPGWRDPALGILGASFLGAVIAGTLALPLYGTMFGPFAMFVVFVASPFTALLWFANLILVHFLMRIWHAERDSIFGASMPTPISDIFAGLLTRISLRP